MLRDDKTVGFGAQDIHFDQKNMEKRIWRVSFDFISNFINRIDEKVVFHSLDNEPHAEIVRIMVKPLIASLVEKGVST